MALANGTMSSRQPYILSVDPVNYSLTTGTNIPPPLDSPPPTPADEARPPTAGGGPLTSHPTTPENIIPGAFPPTPDPEMETMPLTSHANAEEVVPETRQDSFRTPVSPASATQPSSSPEAPPRRPAGVRKLLSLSNLRSSFNSSRTSLSLTRASNDEQYHPPSGLKRPSSPSIHSTTTGSASFPHHHHRTRPTLRQKKSSSWFKRKSGMFLLNSDTLDAVDEDQRPDTRESKRMRESSPAPMLPDISAFGGGDTFSGGALGWDEQLFKR